MLPLVLQAMKNQGYKVFTRGNLNLNLFGIRSNNRSLGEYDDLIGCAWKENGTWNIRYWVGTTDPGVYYSENPLSSKGTAHLVPGQYLRVWGLGLHGSKKYEALTQQYGEVSVYRDNTLDGIADTDGLIEQGYFGINIHASTSTPYANRGIDNTNKKIGRFSAGCQVFAKDTDFLEFMDLVHRSIAAGMGTRFSYTLLTEDQV